MPIKIGCDPEFLVINDDGRTENAEFLSIVKNFGQIGVDHCGGVGELRPHPGTPQEVTKEIKEMMLTIKRNLPSDCKIIAGGGEKYGKSIGGHIHIGGLTNFNHKYYSPTRQANRGRVPPIILNKNIPEHKLIFLLDFFIGKRLKKLNGGKRYGKYYGMLSDIESKSWGFEYRTPPSWLTDPVLTEAVLTIAYQIATIWDQNQVYFDTLINKNKRIAGKKDYKILIPVSNNDLKIYNSYVSEQIKNFKNIVFSKSFKMDDINCINLWTNKKVENKTNNLVTCKVKYFKTNGDFQQEIILTSCKFYVPEIKIYSVNILWKLLNAFSDDIIYIDENFKKYLKIKKNYYNIKIKFINHTNFQFDRQIAFFPSNNKKEKKILDQIIEIFQNDVRKKIIKNE